MGKGGNNEMKKIIILTISLMLAATTGAFALTAVGPVVLGNSWSYGFYETSADVGGVGLFDFIQELSVDPNMFETPANRSMNDGWLNIKDSAQMEHAGGPATNYMLWNINFNGDPKDPVAFYFQAYYKGEKRDSAYVAWNGGSWNITGGSGWQQSSPVPEPLTIFAVLSTMGPAGFLYRRKRRA